LEVYSATAPLEVSDAHNILGNTTSGQLRLTPTGETLETWLCEFGNSTYLEEQAKLSDTKSLVFISYALDRGGEKLLSRKPPFYYDIFEHYSGGRRVTVLIVAQAKAGPSRFLPSNECRLTKTSVRTPLPPKYADCRGDPKGGCHYSFTAASVKLDVLQHVPDELSRVFLVDADVHCVADCVAMLETEFNGMLSTQFITAGRSGVRNVNTRAADGERVPDTDKGIYGGLQSGVLGLDLGKMRRWERTFCPSKPWWHCVVDSRPPSFKWGFADQLVYGELLKDQPSIWKEMPCGVHTDTQVLMGIALLTDCKNRFGVFKSAQEREEHRTKWGSTADSCLADTHGPTAHAVDMQSLRVAFTHDAGGVKRFALGVARALSQGGQEDMCPTRLDLLTRQVQQTAVAIKDIRTDLAALHQLLQKRAHSEPPTKSGLPRARVAAAIAPAIAGGAH
jgi:hypothetical protein